MKLRLQLVQVHYHFFLSLPQHLHPFSSYNRQSAVDYMMLLYEMVSLPEKVVNLSFFSLQALLGTALQLHASNPCLNVLQL